MELPENIFNTLKQMLGKNNKYLALQEIAQQFSMTNEEAIPFIEELAEKRIVRVVHRSFGAPIIVELL